MGMESKPAISYSGSIALQEATVLPDYVGSYDWAKMYNDAQGTDFYTPEMLLKHSKKGRLSFSLANRLPVFRLRF